MKCLICKNDSFHEYLQCDDYFLSGESFNILECKNCKFKFTDPRPSINKISKYYKSEDYISHTDSKKGIVNNIYQLIRKHNVSRKFQMIKRVSSGKNILDIGCGTGDLLKYFKEKEWNSFGIEPDVDARKIALQKGLNVYKEEYLKQFSENQFDVITLWHVLEHVYDISERINEIDSLLNENGILIVALPNCNSWDAKNYGKYWAAWDVPRHLWHWNPATFEMFAEKHGFSLIEKRGMPMDGFYVSMMSEKYKTGKMNLIGGFIRGLSTWFKSLNNNDLSSSVIYFLRKK